MLDALHAGIAGQLAVLDDAGLTGTGQSSADVLGVPGAVLADRLTGHLVREIIVRGSGGGPLAPLADQFNHELTRLQGQRIEGMIVGLAGEVRGALARPGIDVTTAGPPLAEVTDPFVLERPVPVAFLLDRLRKVGADQQAAALTGRLPAVGMFYLFLVEQKGLADQFRFGREADGAPAASWGWEDLDLWLVPDRGDRERPCPSAHHRSAEFAR